MGSHVLKSSFPTRQPEPPTLDSHFFYNFARDQGTHLTADVHLGPLRSQAAQELQGFAELRGPLLHAALVHFLASLNQPPDVLDNVAKMLDNVG